MRKYTYQILLMITAFIWGSAFVAQSEGTAYIGPWTFNSLRCVFGVGVLLLVLPILNKNKTHHPAMNKETIKGGIIAGFIVAFGMYFQQYGIAYTTVGKAGFLSSLYIVIVPLLIFFIKKKTHISIWLAVVLALVGLYYLSFSEAETFAIGDIYIIICAFIFSLHILCIDHFTNNSNPIYLSLIQFIFVSIFSFGPMMILEKPQLVNIQNAIIPILYAGVLSTGVAYTLQVVSQKELEPSLASIIMSLEAVFAAISAYLFLGQTMSAREILGSSLVFASIIIAQLPDILKKG